MMGFRKDLIPDGYVFPSLPVSKNKKYIKTYMIY